MKTLKTLIGTVAVAAMLFLTSCGGGGASGVKCSPEMDAFMKMLDGHSATVKTALAQYGAPGLDNKDMDMYDLKDAKCTACDKDCCTMEAASGMTTRTYVLCWEGGKIKSVEDKGVK